MDRKTFTLIMAVVLIGAFFLPYYSLFGGSVSGLDIVKAPGGGWEKYVLVLIPLSGLLLLLGATSGNYILGRGLLCCLPLLAVLFWIIIAPLIEGASIGNVFKAIGKGYGVGLWVTIVASLILAFYNPKPKA